MSEAVKVERHGAVAVLRLDDPSAMNALSPAVKAGMEANVPRLVADAAVRAIVITGTGKAFCAGGDIRAMKDPEGRKAPAVRNRMRVAHAWARALLDCDKPVIAAVNGAAVGGGLALALLADIVIASREAYFMSGYSKLGALPDLGILQTLPWAIGSLRAKEMIMLNRRYTAEEAVAIGLANRAVAPEKLMAEALAAAEEIASGPGGDADHEQGDDEARLRGERGGFLRARGRVAGDRLRQRRVQRGRRRVPVQAQAAVQWVRRGAGGASRSVSRFSSAPSKMVTRSALRQETCPMDRRITLKDADITSGRSVSRRTLLHSLGLGATAAATVAGLGRMAQQTEPKKPKPADPCRDRDHGPSDRDGCPTS